MWNKVLESPILRVALRYGALSGILVMGFVVSMFYMDKHPFLVNPFLDPRVPVLGLMLFFGLKELRDYYQSGALYFAQGMVTSFLVTVLCAAICWCGILVFATLEDKFVTSFIAQATEQTKSFTAEDIERIGKATFEQSLAELQKADKYFMAGRYFFQTFIISFFISLIVTVIQRRTPVAG
ncbi:MAG: DUF4199 domain-containing protein [Cyclobacteriaceae bacterium]|nr:DUF4199 domain-containing protein [Cyclobacteriaceae bacterium]